MILVGISSPSGVNRMIWIPNVAEFLLYLFEEKQLCARTIEGYGITISSTLSKVLHLNIGADPDISALIQSFMQIDLLVWP